MLLEPFSAGPIETNTYLVGCTDTRKAMVIDAPQGSAQWVDSLCQKHSLTLEGVLLTHSHWDHIADLGLFHQRWGLPIYVHAEDASNVEHPGADGLPLFFPIEGVVPTAYLHDGEKVIIGNLEAEVIHTPGHTPGGVCFYFAKEGVLFSGDTLFQGTIGKLTLPTGQPLRMWKSLQRLAQLPLETKVYPGHGEMTTIRQEQWITQAQERFKNLY